MGALRFAILIVVVSFVSESIAEKRFLLLGLFDIPLKHAEWTSWGQCSAPCGATGTRQRTRGCTHIQFGIIHLSDKCPIQGEQKEPCTGVCPQTAAAVAPSTSHIGTWGNWGMVSSCDKTCGGGIQIRHRVCGGGTCIGDSLESASCNNQQCPGQSIVYRQFQQPNSLDN